MFEGAKRFLGKVKGGLGKGLRLFDKVKGGYDGFKQTLSNLPVVGTAAAGLISKGESAISDYAKAKTGIDPAMIGKGISIARKVESVLPG
jgi:hypothetical protein